MFGSLASKLRYPLLGAAAAALALTTATALAGSGVGGVFNLGQANTVNAESSLTGNTSGGPQLRVENSATTQNAFGVLGRITAGAPGTLSAGIRGINSGTNGNGFGVSASTRTTASVSSARALARLASASLVDTPPRAAPRPE